MGGPLAFDKQKMREAVRREKEQRGKEWRKVMSARRAEEKWQRDIKKLSRGNLAALYVEQKKSMAEIAKALDCSPHKVAYWMDQYKIPRRSRSDATYIKRNPQGDPFLFRLPQNSEEWKLFGLGVGLYWREGAKAVKTNSVRLGNSDPSLLRHFIDFLVLFFGVEKKDMRFGLQLFSDVSVSVALDFWSKELRIGKKQFYKIVVTPARGKGTYTKKSRFGVLTVYYNNKRLKDKLVSLLPM